MKRKDDKHDRVVKKGGEELGILRHSTAHLMAQALKRMIPDLKLGIGPVLEDGFYYDVEAPVPISIDDLPRIEAEMRRIVAEDWRIRRRVVSREVARGVFADRGEVLKLELLAEIPAHEEISLYEQGEFVDLCRGPHVLSTGRLGAFKLLSVAGAYWRGDSDGKRLQRIYGTAFAARKELEAHLAFLEEARKRDHRQLGKQLELFMYSEETPGMPFYLPKGQTVRHELEQFAREVQRRLGYEEVRTPLMMNQRLWEASGHWDHYHEHMYFTEVEDRRYALKPMNCPGHMLIYKSKLRSYRDLPLRLAEFGQVHRHEFSGALGGLLRVRTFCQDDAHIFAASGQIGDEIRQVLRMIDRIYAVFGFDYTVELSTRPEQSLGSDAQWREAEDALRTVLDEQGIDYGINPGDGAFYGPKIDFHIRDALNRSHQCATIQLDFQMPVLFDLSYVDESNEKRHPVVIHRAVYGSIDRFFAVLIEHYAGAFPSWLAPVQAVVLPVSDKHADYAHAVRGQLLEAGVRCELDARKEKVGYRIREAQLQKVPYLLVIGEQEIARGDVSVRRYGQSRVQSMPLEAWLRQLRHEVRSAKRFDDPPAV